jgi:hypothetical protein
MLCHQYAAMSTEGCAALAQVIHDRYLFLDVLFARMASGDISNRSRAKVSGWKIIDDIAIIVSVSDFYALKDAVGAMP